MTETDKLLIRIGTARDAISRKTEQTSLDFMIDGVLMNCSVLLKEQERVMPGADSGMCEICSFYERALPVKPHYNARTNWYECGVCHYSMTSGMHCRSELIPAYKVGFCAKCGKAVMWE